MLSLLLTLCLHPLAQQETTLSEASTAFLADVQESIAKDVKDDGLGALSIAVVIDDDIVWTSAHGLADPENDVAATADTVYRTGSISKSITALIMARLVDEGAFELDESVVDICDDLFLLDGPDESINAITFRHLASHTAGLIREPQLRGAASGPIEGWKDKILESLPHTTFESAPGERFSYSNIGYGTLGYVLDSLTEIPFAELCQRHIFDPAKMEHSFLVIPDDLAKHVAVGTANFGDDVNREAPAREHRGRGYKVPNGGIYASAPDLCRLMALLSRPDGGYLKPSTWKEVSHVQTPEDPKAGYTLGFSIRTDDEGRRILSHGGSVAGYTAHWAFDPDARIGAAIMRSYNQGRTNLSAIQRVVEQLREYEGRD